MVSGRAADGEDKGRENHAGCLKQHGEQENDACKYGRRGLPAQHRGAGCDDRGVPDEYAHEFRCKQAENSCQHKRECGQK